MGWRDKVAMPIALSTALMGTSCRQENVAETARIQFYAEQMQEMKKPVERIEFLINFIKYAASERSAPELPTFSPDIGRDLEKEYTQNIKFILDRLAVEPSLKEPFSKRMEIEAHDALMKQQAKPEPKSQQDRYELFYLAMLQSAVSDIREAMAQGRSKV